MSDAAYHPDPVINAELIEQSIEAERVDLAIGYPPRKWRCPVCLAEHHRGHFLSIGTHRCLACGYAGTGGVMFDTKPTRAARGDVGATTGGTNE